MVTLPALNAHQARRLLALLDADEEQLLALLGRDEGSDFDTVLGCAGALRAWAYIAERTRDAVPLGWLLLADFDTVIGALSQLREYVADYVVTGARGDADA